MRTPQEVQVVDELVAAGMNDCAIARLTGIPRGTIRDWRHGRRPNFDRHPVFDAGSVPEIAREKERPYSYLLGLYLGDGCISRAARTYNLRISLDGMYSGIVEECKAAIESLVPNRAGIVATQSRAVVVSAWSNTWPAWFPQHGPGAKHLRPIVLQSWQREITHREPEAVLRGLIHSDGCRFANRVRVNGKTYTYPRYNFSNRSDDIRRIFCDHLDLLQIPWRRMNRWNISVARREAVARLDEFIGPKQ